MSSFVSNLVRSGKSAIFGTEFEPSRYEKVDWRIAGDGRYDDFTHSSHVMIYAKTDSAFEGHEKKALILMQMRCDGCIGFPGGFIDSGETPVIAACRELKEELNWSEEKGAVKESDYLFSHVDEKSKLVFHFYGTEVKENKMNEIEINVTKAPDYGNEVFGCFRIPLLTMGDAFRGFPSFLKNHFVGNAKLQLIEALIVLKLFNEEQIIEALGAKPIDY